MFENVIVVVPARHQSTRLPNKMLARLADKTVLEHTIDKCLEVIPQDQIVVAVDHPILEEHVSGLGVRCVQTPEWIPDGSTRACWAFKHVDNFNTKGNITHICVVAGDEPCIDPDAIKTAIQFALDHAECDTTLAFSNLPPNADPNDPALGKMIVSETDHTVRYVSRNAIPVNKNGSLSDPSAYKIHVGIYVYNLKAIDLLSNTNVHSSAFLRHVEDREELLSIELGLCTKAVKVKPQMPGVNTQRDLDFLRDNVFELASKNTEDTTATTTMQPAADVQFLDCTLRDGGYLNNWNWTDEHASIILSAVTQAKFDYCEVGYKTDTDMNDEFGKWRQLSDETLWRLKRSVQNSCKLAVMVNVKEVSEQTFECDATQSPVDMIRIFTNSVQTYPKAIHLARIYTNRGFEVTINVGYANRVVENENVLHEIVSHFKDATFLKALYFADSQSKLDPDDASTLLDLMSHQMPGLSIGFHAHNAKSDAMHKTLNAAKHGAKFVDGCISGAGRGPGNLQSELIALQSLKFSKEVNPTPLFRCADWLRDVVQCCYDPIHAWIAHVGCHPDYGNELIDNGSKAPSFLNCLEDATISYDATLLSKEAPFAIVFDLDGTLVDTLPIVAQSMVTATDEELGFECVLKELKKGKRVRDIAKLCPTVDKDTILHRFAELNAIEIGKLGPSNVFNDVLDTLERLRRKNFKLCIATSRSTLVAKSILSQTGLDTFFDSVCGTELDKPGKPNPSVIEHCLTSIDARGVWMVGDTLSDVKAGQALCMQTFLIDRFSDVQKSNATLTADSLFLFNP